jgi:hypothetical protein
MHHVLAFAASALDASAGDVQLNAVADQQFPRSNNNFQVGQELRLLASYSGGIGLTRSRINTASLRQRGFPQIYPMNATTLPPSNGNLMDFRNYPIRLRKEEDFRVDVTNGAANDAVSVHWVTPENPPNFNLNGSDIRAIRFTASATGVAFGWSTIGAITFQDTLEAGIYDIYGMAIQEATTIAGRLVIQGQGLRPGCLGQAATTDAPRPQFFGGLGKWGQFNTYQNPQVELLTTTAGAKTPTGWLLCAKVAEF